MNEIILASAFTMGLMGAGHCAGMCGGIVGALSASTEIKGRDSIASRLPIVSAYNTGRLLSYSIAGALFGLVGGAGWSLLTPDAAIQYSRYVSVIFMIGLALYLLGWGQGLLWLERIGARLWRYIEPQARRFLPIRHPGQALVLGMAWGWLPCGMVYTALGWALLSGSAFSGALIMLAFGAGTLPMLMSLGIGANWIMRWSRRPRVRQLSAVILMGLAGYLLINQHSPHHQAIGATVQSHWM
jgi:sulfite exporter TauE/SafE